MPQERNATAGLLDRPLAPRSLIGSLLLGMRPPRMAGGRLVSWCGLFGVAEGTARVALSRMVERGELVARGGTYELAGAMRARQPAQDWSLRPRLEPWSGDWLLGVVEPGARTAAERASLRDAARRLRMVELRDAVWCRPANLPRVAAPTDAWDVADTQCQWWTGRPERDGVAAATARFAPEAWADRARVLRDRLDAATAAVDASDGTAIADAFVVGAAALAHVRADPLLPAELCGRRWPGDALRDAYREYREAFGDAIRGWFRKQ
jgi:phenylacetic acid degradation operon negative regulatory protein